MAPVQKKRVSEPEAENPEKRRRVEDDEEAEDEVEVGDDDSAEDEDEDEDFDPEQMFDMSASFAKEDFDCEITDEQLEKFNTAFDEFMQELDESNDQPMVMGKPNAIRPIPTTKEEFKNNLPWINLSEAVNEFSDSVRTEIETAGEQIEEALEELEEKEFENDEAKEAEVEKVMESLHRERVEATFKIFNKTFDTLEKAVEADDDKKDLWGKFIVTTDAVFDEEVHTLFVEEKDAARAVALVGRLESVWNKLAALKDDEIGCTAKLRKDTAGMIANMEEALHKGDFAQPAEDGEVINPHKETKFCPKLC